MALKIIIFIFAISLALGFPTSTQIKDVPLSVKEIKIFDVSGTLVKEEKVTSAQEHKQEVKISLKGINPGIYFLRLGKETKKFLVVK